MFEFYYIAYQNSGVLYQYILTGRTYRLSNKMQKNYSTGSENSELNFVG